MITRLLLAFAVVVAGIVAVAILLTRSGNERAAQTGSALSWKQDPTLFGVASLPRDRVAIGRVVNTGSDPVTLSADAFEVRDSDERKLDGRVQFIDTRRRNDSLGLGTDVQLEPAEVTPLTISFRLEASAVKPLTVFFEGEPALPLPEGPLNPQRPQEPE